VTFNGSGIKILYQIRHMDAAVGFVFTSGQETLLLAGNSLL
jgi:hypothetical protein